MEKNEGIIASLGKVITTDGSITGSALQGALKKVDLNYAFNNGKLIITEKEGIWGISDDGVVAYRGGGIFTSNQKDASGNWIWNTGIVPQGINASVITAGQLDTNRVMVYAGDRLRFQLNGDGLFAYKSFLSDFMIEDDQHNPVRSDYVTAINNRTSDIDYGQYLVVNDNGLFLKAKKGSYVINDTATDYIKIGYDSGDVPVANFPDELSRVSLSWDGLKMRNWRNQITFFASASSGDLFLSGTLNADHVYVTNNEGWAAGIQGVSLVDWYESRILLSENLASIFAEAAAILDAATSALTYTHTLTQENTTVLESFETAVRELTPKTYTTAARPSTFRPGDIWEPASGTYAGNKYIAISYSSKSIAGDGEDSETHVYDNPLGGWNRVSDGSLASITGAGINIDTESGILDLYAGSKISLKAKSQLDLAAGDIQITGNNSINIGSKWINIGSSNGGINIVSTDINVDTTTDNDGKVNTTGVVSKVQLDRSGIKMHSNTIELMAGDSDSVAALKLNPSTGIWMGSNKEVRFFSGTLPSSGNSGANILLNADKIHLGVSGGNNGAAAILTKDQIFFAVGSVVTTTTTKITTSTGSGVQIQKDYIGMALSATRSGSTYRSLVSIKPDQILIGSATGAITEASLGNGTGLNGSYIKIANGTKPIMEIGSTGQLIIRTSTLFLDNQATGTNAMFALRKVSGNSSEDILTFSQTNGLSIKGAITATAFTLASGVTIPWGSISNKPTFETNGVGWQKWPSSSNDYYVSLTSAASSTNNTPVKGILIGYSNTSSLTQHLIVPYSADRSEKVVDISRDGIQFNHYTTQSNTPVINSYIHIDSSGIALQGAHIRVNGEEVWERGDIIWGADQPSHAGNGSWIWIKPDAMAQLNYAAQSGDPVDRNYGSHWSKYVVNVVGAAEGFSYDPNATYIYTVTVTGRVIYSSHNYSYSGGLTCYLIAGASQYEIGNRSISCAQGGLTTGNVYATKSCATQTMTANIPGVNVTTGSPAADITLLFQIDSGGESSCFRADSLALTVQTQGTGSAVSRCTVYYFPPTSG